MNSKSIMALTVSMLVALPTMAFEDVDAKSLVGQGYGGIHYTNYFTDDNRAYFNNEAASVFDDGDGFGVDIGFRFTESNEIRIRYTDLELETKPNLHGDVDGSLVGIDILHFATKKNVYVLAGLKELDFSAEEVSVNAGIGYRHYFSKQFAAFAEAKGHYQFEESQKEFSTTVGLMYFFGSNDTPKKKVVKKAPEPAVAAAAPVVVAPKDSDRDGIFDDKDQCANTPETHFVDAVGCTVYIDETDSMSLDINFDNNSDVIKPEHFAEVEAAANFMKRYPEVSLTIEGHTSSQGKAAYNKSLSQKRADAVVSLLVKQYDIDSSRLAAKGYGEEQLLNDANTSQAHAENRRIHAQVSVTGKVAKQR